MILKPSMRSDLPTGTVTFLFTDVEGSTRLLEELGDEAYEEALAEHRRIVREACAEHGGVEVDTQGDAFFFGFSTAPAAVAAASAMTTALGSGPIRVRVGLHTGEPRVSDEGYVGKEVHYAARVAATGHGGQIVLSKATAELVEADLTDLGEHRLKDIPEPVPIYQLRNETFPPLKTISNTNLPRPASSFVGREAELRAVLERIKQGASGARLLTLTGAGGSGKTRLALEAASTLVSEYKAGVFWVGLAPLREPALVTETIAQTLGAKDGLAEHIGEREMLLLLDNLEQVVEAAPELPSLLEACPNLTLLCTSRELLRVRGEVEYAVPPLASPEAVALFCERSRLEPSEEIAELCARLDSLPLAVELAAARTKALSPRHILERLSQRLDLFKGGRDADPRQQTLRATIEWSYELLSEEEKRLFRSLSVFAGGCTLEAAKEVADADLDTLQSLVEKSLLRFTDDRYSMLETIRDYATDRLVHAPRPTRVWAQHAGYFAALGEQADANWESRQSYWIQILEREHDNFRAAHAWSQEAGERTLELRLTACLGNLWGVRGYAGEGRRWAEDALARSSEATDLRLRVLRIASLLALDEGDFGRGEALTLERLELARSLADIQTVARSLSTLGVVATENGDFARATSLYVESMELFRRRDDRAGLAIVLLNLAELRIRHGEWTNAERQLDEALALFRGLDSTDGIAECLRARAQIELHGGRDEDALQSLAESLRLFGDIRHTAGVARSLHGLVALLLRRDAPLRAAHVMGAADRLLELSGRHLSSIEQEWLDDTRTKLHSELDERSRTTALLRGRDMELEEVVHYAIASLS